MSMIKYLPFLLLAFVNLSNGCDVFTNESCYMECETWVLQEVLASGDFLSEFTFVLEPENVTLPEIGSELVVYKSSEDVLGLGTKIKAVEELPGANLPEEKPMKRKCKCSLKATLLLLFTSLLGLIATILLVLPGLTLLVIHNHVLLDDLDEVDDGDVSEEEKPIEQTPVHVAETIDQAPVDVAEAIEQTPVDGAEKAFDQAIKEVAEAIESLKEALAIEEPEIEAEKPKEILAIEAPKEILAIEASKIVKKSKKAAVEVGYITESHA
jgi:hypothetical protein